MLQCDWCHKPISGEKAKGWGYQVELTPFHPLALSEKQPAAPNPIALELHLHPKPCKDELGWAIADLLENREPLETDGPDLDEVDDDVEETQTETKEERIDRERRERFERAIAWRRVERVERERLLLEALGEDRLTICELVERMRVESPHYDLYESHVRPIALRLYKEARELDRAADPRKKARPRYIYFRRGLEGPIAELERTFHEPGEGGRS